MYEPIKVELTLRYDGSKIGSVKDAFCSDNTWYGIFSPTLQSDLIGKRVSEYIDFSIDWNERLNNGDEPDDNEFMKFKDLLKSGLWSVEDKEAKVSKINEAPVFFKGNEITWNCT